MRYIFYILFVLIVSSVCLTSCKDEENDNIVPESLISSDALLGGTSEWIIMLGNGEDCEGATTTDQYIIKYQGTGSPAQVQLIINENSYTLDSESRTKYYYFAGETQPIFNAGENYSLKLIVDNVVKAESVIKMVDAPVISTSSFFNSTQDKSFQWLIENNPMVQYFLAELPSGTQVELSTLSPTTRHYTIASNTLQTQTGWYEFAVVNANYKEVNNVRFITMFAGWTSCQQR